MADDNQNNQQEEAQAEATLEKIQADLDAAMNGWKRTAADFENFRRRKEDENKELVEFAKEVTVVKLLPTLDSLEQALRHMPEVSDKLQVTSEKTENQKFSGHSDDNSENSGRNFFDKYRAWQKGIEVLLKQLDKLLEELGVKKIEALGKKFDPNFHEAVREMESGAEEGTVLEELQSGFELNGKVIRPSQVIISKRKDS